MGRWRKVAGALAVVVLFGTAGDHAAAQDVPASAILTIDQDRLFLESLFGKAVIAREAAEATALEAENARIEADLIAEEQDLTDRRETLPSDEFSALAAAFDAKVVRIRSEQDAKARDLTRTRDTDRQAFFRAAVPVLGDLLVERKAVAIIDKSAVILSLTSIDVTEAVIAKVNAALPPGPTASGTTPDPTPSPEAAPTADPAAPSLPASP